MSVTPTSHFITLPNRPIVQKSGQIYQSSLQLHYWQWKGHLPTILICHAGSFHSRCYDRIVREALAGHHVIALDFRGHGRSQKHPPPYQFRWFGEDLLQFIEILHLPTAHLLGIGHSLGGHALVLASVIASRPLFRSLLLLDPALYAPYFYEIVDQTTHTGEVVTRRKRQWSSVEDMISYMKSRRTLSQWPEDVLRDYCTYALEENLQLACTPENELSIYRASVELSSKIYSLIKEAKFLHDISVHIVRASTDRTSGKFEPPPTAPNLVTCFQRGRDTYFPEVRHLFPIEQPQVTVPFVRAWMADEKNSRSHL